jgi:crossover junction endodeoxyribonuclease RusA
LFPIPRGCYNHLRLYSAAFLGDIAPVIAIHAASCLRCFYRQPDGYRSTSESKMSENMPGPGAALHIVLPLPPSINEQYATIGKRRVSSKPARRFKREVRNRIRAMEYAGQISDGLRECLRSSYLALFLDFYFETPFKRDLDGGLKIALDALCEALGLNDNRIVDIHLVKRIAPLQPRLEVSLEAIADWQFDEVYVLLRRDETCDTGSA